MTAVALPRIDEHAVAVAAPPSAVFDTIVAMFGRATTSSVMRGFTWVLGCEPVSGFEITEQARPTRIVLTGRHRFSTYSIVFHIDPIGMHGCVCRAESFGAFPGVAGTAYRALVVGSRGHVVATKGLLELIKRRTLSGTAAPTPGV